MAAKRGRTAGFEMSHEHRLKIKNSNILNCLIQHAEGTREMTSTQVTAGLGLLNKVLPNLSESKQTNVNIDASIDEMSDHELDAAIALLRARLSGVAENGGEQAQAVDPSQLN